MPTTIGRVYDVNADESKGETAGRFRVWVMLGTWFVVPYSCRVEFDDDTDNGMATVTALYIFHGSPVPDPDDVTKPAKARFRARARVKPITDECPDPQPE